MTNQKRQFTDVLDEIVEVDFYEEKHRPQYCEMVGNGYPLNPFLREDFSRTSNDHREPLEIEDWWDRPYLESCTWQESEAHLRKFQQSRENVPSPEQAEAEVEKHKASFFSSNPTGIEYTVNCLDGGAWDRPSIWGVFPTLDEAISCCERGPAWRQAGRDA
ncbi:hypothetical protein BKM17_23070 [Pseudomonas syringae group genomosp. 3]|nr:hypothetical protein BKM17_23070 [Pseudomonas syringae group genomosp. 3]